MGQATYNKWVDRAEKYEEILLDSGVVKAGHYLNRFRGKVGRLLEALWDVHLDRLYEEEIEGVYEY